MIVCLAANPSIDKLFEVQRLVRGDIHRPSSFVQTAGGKGLDLARPAHRPRPGVAVARGHSAARGSWTPAPVEFEPRPPTTWHRPAANWTARRITSMCSSVSRVADSPVVPTGTMPSTPPAIWRSMRFW